MKINTLAKSLAFFAILLLLIGCSSDSNVDPSNAEEISRELLIGTWTRNQADMVLNQDGTGESEVFDFDSGSSELQFRPLTWRLETEVLTINFSVTGTSMFRVIEINGRGMTLEDSDGVRRDYIRK